MDQLSQPVRPFRAAFRNYFLSFALLLTASGLGRWAIGDIRGFDGFLAWELVYIPLSALMALIFAWLKPNPEIVIHRKPRIFAAVLVGLGICAGSLLIGWLIFR